MTPYQKVISFFIAFALLVVVLELVRRRTMRVEYSWLWILAIAGLMVLIVVTPLLSWLTELVGAVDPSSTIILIAFVFLALICIHFTVKISELSNQVKKLTQQLAILEAEKNALERRAHPGAASGEDQQKIEAQEALDRA